MAFRWFVYTSLLAAVAIAQTKSAAAEMLAMPPVALQDSDSAKAQDSAPPAEPVVQFLLDSVRKGLGGVELNLQHQLKSNLHAGLVLGTAGNRSALFLATLCVERPRGNLGFSVGGGIPRADSQELDLLSDGVRSMGYGNSSALWMKAEASRPLTPKHELSVRMFIGVGEEQGERFLSASAQRSTRGSALPYLGSSLGITF